MTAGPVVTGSASSGGRRLRRLLRDERGASPVEFVLIGTLLTTLFLALVQLGIALYVRNVVVSSAAEGARYGANANRTVADGVERTRRLIDEALPGSIDPEVTGRLTTSADGSLQLVEISVSARLPVFGTLGPSGVLDAQGHALVEGQ